MNTNDPRSIARTIRSTLKVHERTHRAAIRLPDDAAQLVADVLDHYAATCDPIVHEPIYDRRAVLWMEAAAHVAKLLSLTDREAIDLTEVASDALGIRPGWRDTQKGIYFGRYLTFTGREVARIVRYAQKRSEA